MLEFCQNEFHVAVCECVCERKHMGLSSMLLLNKADRVEGSGSRWLCSQRKALQKSMGWGGGVLWSQTNAFKTMSFLFYFIYAFLCKRFLTDPQISPHSAAPRLMVCSSLSRTPLHRNVSTAGSWEKRGLINRAPLSAATLLRKALWLHIALLPNNSQLPDKSGGFAPESRGSGGSAPLRSRVCERALTHLC